MFAAMDGSPSASHRNEFRALQLKLRLVCGFAVRWLVFEDAHHAQADRLRRRHFRQADAAWTRADGDLAGTGRRSFCRPPEEARRTDRLERCASQERRRYEEGGSGEIKGQQAMTPDPDPFEEGRRAARKNIPAEANPYQEG